MNRYARMLWMGVLAVMGIALHAQQGHATISDANRTVTLPQSLYQPALDIPAGTVDPNLDRDKDGLKDDLEARLADIWRPYFVFDQNENDTSSNTSELSLQSWEPRVLFQVRPVGNRLYGGTRTVRITYAFLFRMDGGFRGADWCTNHHSGDSQKGFINLTSADGGRTWRLSTLDMYGNTGTIDANSSSVAFTTSYYANHNGTSRPLPKVYMSAGKHHQFTSGPACEDAASECNDDCGGGVARIANLNPWGYYTNVGEPENHPADWGTNQPFVNDLWHIGYPNEHTWFAAWVRSDCDNPDVFTGGMNSGPNNTGNWIAGGGDTCVSAVYKLFPKHAMCSNANSSVSGC